MPKGFQGFQKGHPSYIKKAPPNYRNCLRCGTQFIATNVQLSKGWGKYCSRNCSNKAVRRTGEQLYNWKGDKVGYSALHDWLALHYGKANKCENPNCLGTSQKFQWSLLKHKKYERKRENFWMLCARCHVHYDNTIPYVSKGVPVPKERRLKISKTLKKYYANRKN